MSWMRGRTTAQTLTGSAVDAAVLARRQGSDAAWSQSFETLATSLLLRRSDRPLRTLLVTSTQPGEGKSTVATSLALALARAGRQVLIADADLRRPVLHRAFAIDGSVGMADLLDGRAGVSQALQRIDVAAGSHGAVRLGVLPAGRDADGGAFARMDPIRARKLVASLGEQHDLAIFDSPPVLAVSDALLLAPLVDGVLFVVGAGRVPERDAVRATQRLAAAGATLVGAFLNGVTDAADGYHPYAPAQVG